jgi:membrane fusion protein, multidrug efflux system
VDLDKIVVLVRLVKFSWDISRMNYHDTSIARRRKMQCGAYAITCIILPLLTACSSAPTPGVAAPLTEKAASAVGPSRQQPEQSDFIASGPLVVENQIDLAAQRDGVVSEVLIDTAAPVRKGQLLARLDDRQLTAERDAAAAKASSIAADVKNWEAGEKVAKSDFERNDAMWKANIVSKQVADHAKYQYEAVQFEVERERENLKYSQNTLQSLDLELEKTTIVAPFAGVVARRYVHLGQQVSKNDRLFWISATGPLRVKFTLPEIYAGRVKRGTELVVSPSGAPDQIHSAKVVTVSPVVDPSSDTIDVTAQLEGRTQGLLPGMTINIRLRNRQ